MQIRSLWKQLKFHSLTGAVGPWQVVREVRFEHEHAPTALKCAIEKLTAHLLRREPIDVAALALRYSGTSGAGGHPSTVRLALEAVGSGMYLYTLTSERTAPRGWHDERRFIVECDEKFAHWCSQLRIVPAGAGWPAAPRCTLEQTILETAAAEEAAARIVEDQAPVAAVQLEVLRALRTGMGFFTVHKEGGSHLFFDGKVYRRIDYGDEPNLSEIHADDAAMIDCLRRFYDWDAQRDVYPHVKTELEVWRYIWNQLRQR